MLITGHTGFKGSWLVLWLRKMGATTFGVALPPVSPLSLFCSAELGTQNDQVCDVRNLTALQAIFQKTKPDIVFHLAAQPIVGLSYQDPVGTFATNVMGSAHVLECVRSQAGIAATVMITSDKCYENVEQLSGYREGDRLGGVDPYSASKAAAEIVISSFTRSYLQQEDRVNVASARAGNVVGGGDWSEFRLIPDCIRSLRAKTPISLRSPQATRPWQFVLEPLAGYLLLGLRLAQGSKDYQGAWNFGPPGDNTKTVELGAQSVIDAWGEGSIDRLAAAPFHESQLLQLDSTKARCHLGWRSVIDFSGTMALTAQWYKHQHTTGDASMREFSLGQIRAFEETLNRNVLL